MSTRKPKPSKTRITQCIRRGFFSLPRELRNYIYWLILYPTPPVTHLGSTKILVLCTQTYREAVMYLKEEVIALDVGKRWRLFRDPKATGLPNTLHSTARTSQCWKPQDHSELQLTRYSVIHATIHLPYVRWRNVLEQDAKLDSFVQTSAKIQTNLRELANVVSKSTHLRQLRVHVTAAHAACRSMGGVTANIGALAAAVAAQGASFEVCHSQASSASDTTQAASPWDARPAMGFYQLSTVDAAYALVPECRRCLGVFESRAALCTHLDAHPHHAQRFVKRSWNTIRQAGIVSSLRTRVCWACGARYAALASLQRHLQANKTHIRHGMVPRYREDNARYDRFWKRHRDKKGWL